MREWLVWSPHSVTCQLSTSSKQQQQQKETLMNDESTIYVLIHIVVMRMIIIIINITLPNILLEYHFCGALAHTIGEHIIDAANKPHDTVPTGIRKYTIHISCTFRSHVRALNKVQLDDDEHSSQSSHYYAKRSGSIDDKQKKHTS